jgi:hypothetical protein
VNSCKPGGDYGLIIESPVSHNERWGFCVKRGVAVIKAIKKGWQNHPFSSGAVSLLVNDNQRLQSPICYTLIVT